MTLLKFTDISLAYGAMPLLDKGVGRSPVASRCASSAVTAPVSRA